MAGREDFMDKEDIAEIKERPPLPFTFQTRKYSHLFLLQAAPRLISAHITQLEH
jgi:hypothetical protein